MSLIKKPADLEIQTTIKILLYGQPGIGKSTLALSAPSPLLLDFDGGVHRINPLHQVDTVQIKSWQDCLDVLKEDLSAYRSIAIDTAGKMLDFMAMHIIKKNPKMGKANGALTLQGYGERKAEFRNFLKQVSLMGKHLVFVAHDQEEKDGDNKIIRPEIGGSSAGDLVKELDLVGYMEARGKMRTISFDPQERFYAKNTCRLDPIIEVATLLNQQGGVLAQNNFLSEIFTTYHQNLESRKKIAVEYNELMQGMGDVISAIKDGDDANNAVEKLKNINHIWDSLIQLRMQFNSKVKELGLELDKKTGKYLNAKENAGTVATNTGV